MAPRKEDNSPHHQFYRKFRPGEMINSQAKQVILNVFFQISTLNPAKSWNKVALEAAMLTGVCSKTIFKLKSEKQATLYLDNPHPEPAAPVDENADDVGGAALGGEEGGPPAKPPTKKRKKGEKREKKEPRPPSPRSIKRKCTVRPKKRIERYDESVLTAIRLKMHEYLGRNEPPTVSKVLGDINMDEQLPNFSRSTFHRILKDMGLTTYLQTPHGPKKKVKPDPNGGPGGPGGRGVGQQGVVGGQGGQVGQGVAGGSAGGVGGGAGGGQMSQHHQSHANPATLPLNYGHPQIRDHHSLPMHNVSRMGFQ